MPDVLAYAIDSPTGSFSKTTITRREPGPTEVFFDVLYAGICHSDIHTARGEWGPARYPLVPGHELAGVVRQVGSEVTKFAVGDHVGVGCFVDSCGTCEMCEADNEHFCDGEGGTIWTYNAIGRDGVPTAGGYSQGITVEQDYVCRIPDAIDLTVAAPLLCAGITLYSPLKRWGAVRAAGRHRRHGRARTRRRQIAAAMGAEVTVLSQGLSKKDDGLALGASHYYATSDPTTYRSLRGAFDVIVSTVSATEDFTKLVDCLRVGGTMANVGLPELPVQLSIGALGANKSVTGSMIGGIAETQEMLDFCAEHGLAARIETIPASKINGRTTASSPRTSAILRHRRKHFQGDGRTRHSMLSPAGGLQAGGGIAGSSGPAATLAAQSEAGDPMCKRVPARPATSPQGPAAEAHRAGPRRR